MLFGGSFQLEIITFAQIWKVEIKLLALALIPQNVYVCLECIVTKHSQTHLLQPSSMKPLGKIQKVHFVPASSESVSMVIKDIKEACDPCMYC